jgi:hypothetical protein
VGDKAAKLMFPTKRVDPQNSLEGVAIFSQESSMKKLLGMAALTFIVTLATGSAFAWGEGGDQQ